MMTDQQRKTLVTKLKTLIAVVQVALVKIEHAKKNARMDPERADVITANLENTLGVCRRALTTLQQLPAEQQPFFKPSPSGAREYTEMSSVNEYRKFQKLPPIAQWEIEDVDIDALIEELLPDV